MPLLILQAKAPLEPRDDRTLVAVSQNFILLRDHTCLPTQVSPNGFRIEKLQAPTSNRQ